MTLKNNRAPLLHLCASFHHHVQIQTGVMVWKQLNWVLISVTLTFDLWSWSFAWTSLPVIGNKWQEMKISWWYNDGNIVKKVWQTDGRTDRQTDGRTEPFVDSCLVAAKTMHIWSLFAVWIFRISWLLNGICIEPFCRKRSSWQPQRLSSWQPRVTSCHCSVCTPFGSLRPMGDEQWLACLLITAILLRCYMCQERVSYLFFSYLGELKLS